MDGKKTYACCAVMGVSALGLYLGAIDLKTLGEIYAALIPMAIAALRAGVEKANQ